MKSSFFSVFYQTFRYEILLVYRHYSEMLNPILFFVIVLSLFPLGVSPDAKMLQTIAPGVIWVIALLTILLGLERLFRDDFQDGSLEQLLLSSQPLVLLVFAKILAQWLVSGLPLILIAPLLAMSLHLPSSAFLVLVASLLLGTPVLVFLGAIARGLTVSLRNSGLLVILLVLPLYIPVLIFGASAIAMASQGLSANGQLAWLGALLVLSLPLASITTVAALRIGVG